MKIAPNPFSVIISICLLVICSLAHLAYASCQNSKWHYILQEYYLCHYFPNWMLIGAGQSKNGLKVYDKYSGTWNTWYGHGQKYSTCIYADGQKHGTYANWYESGEKLSQAFYTEGKINGKALVWFKNGCKKIEFHYNKNINAREYNKSKKPFSIPVELNEDDNCAKHGKEIHWYENGKIASRDVYKNNKIISTEKWNKLGVKTSSKFQIDLESSISNKTLLDGVYTFQVGEMIHYNETLTNNKHFPIKIALHSIQRKIFKVSEYLPGTKKMFLPFAPSDLRDIIFIDNDKRYQGFLRGYSISCGGRKIHLSFKQKQNFSFSINEPGEYIVLSNWNCHQEIHSNEIVIRVFP